MAHTIDRRQFIQLGAIAAGAFSFPSLLRSAADRRRVRVGVIGAGGRGGANISEIVNAKIEADIVALCDIDAGHLAGTAKRFPEAHTYSDYRKMLEAEAKNIDAVLVATPDHHHFPASMMAIALGKHVYCEKPLTHSIWEARTLAEAARKAKVATQMGTQGHAGEPIRLLQEWLAAGAIGTVREVHIWTDRPAGWWPQGMDRPADTPAVPSNLNWDAWIGPAPMRPYHPAYHPFKWRGWWDFGTGALGDIGCHAFDLPWTALKLTAPTSVESVTFGGKPECGPVWSDIVFEFPANGDRPALKLFWYDGRNHDTAKDSPAWKSLQKIRDLLGLAATAPWPENGSLYIGDKGKMTVGGGPRLLPESAMASFQRPPKTLERSIGHHAEWIRACQGGKPAEVNFDYAGPLAEAVLLGNLSVRFGKRIEWDSAKLSATNAPEAAALIRREYRKGWNI